MGTLDREFARHGGYVWVYSPDGSLRAGEGPAGQTAAWVQPPGSPTVGMAILEAYRATGEAACLDAARDTAHALVRGQLHSGGWPYRIDFEPEDRKGTNYRVDGGPNPKAAGPAGWDTWKQRKNRGNRSMLDDDTTQAALRFLLEFHREVDGGDKQVRGALDYGLAALRGTQYPCGAWSHNFDAFPDPPPEFGDYPVFDASYPESWPRTWPKEWAGCYHLNDNITPDAIATLLLAHEVLGDRTFLDAARRGGEFLIRAQMPDPQPAWAQQYDKHMHPVWERKFEPPAITGGESQGAMEILIALFHATGEERFLEPVPRALAYLRRSLLPDGRLARYYELRTNRPLYFTRDYKLTGDGGDVPDHYAFVTPSRLDKIEELYREARAGKPPRPAAVPGGERVADLLATRDPRGIWLEPGVVRDHRGRKVRPEAGIVSSRTVARNLTALSRYLSRHHPSRP
ncbi:MAG: polysaccharide lyase [Akkermansiaceae bacterium]|nr:polysaccharide lyase [Akkermansiaceae bacterium]